MGMPGEFPQLPLWIMLPTRRNSQKGNLKSVIMKRFFDFAVAIVRDSFGDVLPAEARKFYHNRASLFADSFLFFSLFTIVGVLAKDATFALVFGFTAAVCFIGWWLSSGRRKAISDDHRARKLRSPKIVERALDRDP